MREVVYKPADRPTVEVLVDGVWRYAELRMWSQRADGWWASCAWQPALGESYRLDTFQECDVRPLEDVTPYLRDGATGR